MAGITNPIGDLSSVISRNISSKLFLTLRKTDRDGSGSVSRDEFEGGDDAFNVLDVNGDGVIDRADFESFIQSEGGSESPLRQMLNGLMDKVVKGSDQNDDGRLSREEFDGEDREFERIDRDHDGYISSSELAGDLLEQHPSLAMQTELISGLLDRAYDRDGQPNDVRSIAKQTFEKTVTALDRDGDGFLSADEIDMDENTFRSIDRDENGLIDAKELTDRFMTDYEDQSQRFSYDTLIALMEELSKLTHRTDRKDESDKGRSIDVKG